MTQHEIIKAIESLPPEGQRQVIELINALHQYYDPVPLAEKNVSDLSTDAFVGLWRSRDDLEDGHSWVRHIRRLEWTR